MNRRATDAPGQAWVHPNAREMLAEVFADDDAFYVEPPTVPEGMTLPEYRRARWQTLADAA